MDAPGKQGKAGQTENGEKGIEAEGRKEKGEKNNIVKERGENSVDNWGSLWGFGILKLTTPETAPDCPLVAARTPFSDDTLIK